MLNCTSSCVLPPATSHLSCLGGDFQLTTEYWQLFLSCAPAVQIPAEECTRISGAVSVLPPNPHRPYRLGVRFNLFFIPRHRRRSAEKKFAVAQLLCIDRFPFGAYSRSRLSTRERLTEAAAIGSDTSCPDFLNNFASPNRKSRNSLSTAPDSYRASPEGIAS
jgi:hypothetical protein